MRRGVQPGKGEYSARPHERTRARTDKHAAIPRALNPGASVADYVLYERLGGGQMGEVWSATDPRLDRKVALKVLPREVASEDEVAQARLLREAEAMARVRDANVVTVLDVGSHGGDVFVVMELIEGTTLRKWLQKSRGWKETLEVFLAAGRGLAAIHEGGIVHRDFKPDNVMIDKVGRVQVMDLGLSRGSGLGELSEEDMVTDESGLVWLRGVDEREAAELESEVAKSGKYSGGREDLYGDHISLILTDERAAVGTPAYMAPEQHLGRKAEFAADQFAFGVALYEALFGERPFAGVNGLQIGKNVVAGRRREFPKESDVPKYVRDALAQALEVEPSKRHPDMRTFLTFLQDEPKPKSVIPWVVGTLMFGLSTAGLAALSYWDHAGRPAELEAAAAANAADTASEPEGRAEILEELEKLRAGEPAQLRELHGRAKGQGDAIAIAEVRAALAARLESSDPEKAREHAMESIWVLLAEGRKTSAARTASVLQRLDRGTPDRAAVWGELAAALQP